MWVVFLCGWYFYVWGIDICVIQLVGNISVAHNRLERLSFNKTRLFSDCSFTCQERRALELQLEQLEKELLKKKIESTELQLEELNKSSPKKVCIVQHAVVQSLVKLSIIADQSRYSGLLISSENFSLDNYLVRTQTLLEMFDNKMPQLQLMVNTIWCKICAVMKYIQRN